MNHQNITSRFSSPVGAIVLGMTGVILLAVAVVQANVDMALGAVLPLFLAIGLAFSRPRSFAAAIEDDRLSVLDPPVEIPYASIQSLTLKGAPQLPGRDELKPGPILLLHEKGSLEIPASISVPVTDLYVRLVDATTTSGAHDVHSELSPTMREQQEQFGNDRVWTFRARERLGVRLSHRRAKLCGLAIALSGVVWCVAAASLEPRVNMEVWIAGGVISMLVGGFTILIAWAHRRHPGRGIKGWKDSSIVIGPLGIAMIQGDVRGKLEWRELRDVVSKGGRGIPRHVPGSIGLVVEGAVIPIVDIYDRPLAAIFKVIRRSWRPD